MATSDGQAEIFSKPLPAMRTLEEAIEDAVELINRLHDEVQRERAIGRLANEIAIAKRADPKVIEQLLREQLFGDRL